MHEADWSILGFQRKQRAAYSVPSVHGPLGHRLRHNDRMRKADWLVLAFQRKQRAAYGF